MPIAYTRHSRQKAINTDALLAALSPPSVLAWLVLAPHLFPQGFPLREVFPIFAPVSLC